MSIRHISAAALTGLSLLVCGIAASPASAHGWNRDGYRYDRGGWFDGHSRYHRFDREGYRHDRDGWYDRSGRFHRFS
jgi:hypothetical protein